MQFINIVVHSVENMNFRVHLQYEFTHLGLDKYLEVCLKLFKVPHMTRKATANRNVSFDTASKIGCVISRYTDSAS